MGRGGGGNNATSPRESEFGSDWRPSHHFLMQTIELLTDQCQKVQEASLFNAQLFQTVFETFLQVNDNELDDFMYAGILRRAPCWGRRGMEYNRPAPSPTLCEALPAAWEGRRAAEAALVSRGTTVPRSCSESIFPQWLGTNSLSLQTQTSAYGGRENCGRG